MDNANETIASYCTNFLENFDRTPELKEAIETEELFYDITFSSNYRRLDQTLKSNLLSRLEKLKSLAIFY